MRSSIAIALLSANLLDAAFGCCNIIADKETCPDPYVSAPSAGTATINGVVAATCCEDPEVVNVSFNGDTWCDGSNGKSEEKDPINDITESSNYTVLSNYTVEESHTTTIQGTTTTTTTKTISGMTCSSQDICVCSGNCPAFVSDWETIVQEGNVCIAAAISANYSLNPVVVNGATYESPLVACSKGGSVFDTYYHASVLVATIVGGLVIAL